MRHVPGVLHIHVVLPAHLLHDMQLVASEPCSFPPDTTGRQIGDHPVPNTGSAVVNRPKAQFLHRMKKHGGTCDDDLSSARTHTVHPPAHRQVTCRELLVQLPYLTDLRSFSIRHVTLRAF